MPENTLHIYVVTEEPYHDNSTILTAYLTLEEAQDFTQNGEPISWAQNPHNKDVWYQKESDPNENDLFITRVPLEIGRSNLLHNFAISILNNDPIACDAVKDILRI